MSAFGALLVFQLPKCGSKTLHEALKRAAGSVPVHHAHALSAQAAERYDALQREFPGTDKYAAKGERLRRLAASIAAIDARIAVVTTVREPVARAVSAFFHTLPRRHPELIDPGAHPGDVSSRLQAALLERLDFWLAQSTRWFDEELRPLTGLDVCARDFPWDQGHARHASPRAELLLLRLEDLDRVAPAALGRLLGLAGIDWRPVHRGVDGVAGALYARFLQDVRLPARVVRAAYAAPWVRRFYAPDELRRFEARWTDHADAPTVGLNASGPATGAADPLGP